MAEADAARADQTEAQKAVSAAEAANARAQSEAVRTTAHAAAAESAAAGAMKIVEDVKRDKLIIDSSADAAVAASDAAAAAARTEANAASASAAAAASAVAEARRAASAAEAQAAARRAQAYADAVSANLTEAIRQREAAEQARLRASRIVTKLSADINARAGAAASAASTQATGAAAAAEAAAAAAEAAADAATQDEGKMMATQVSFAAASYRLTALRLASAKAYEAEAAIASAGAAGLVKGRDVSPAASAAAAAAAAAAERATAARVQAEQEERKADAAYNAARGAKSLDAATAAARNAKAAAVACLGFANTAGRSAEEAEAARLTAQRLVAEQGPEKENGDGTNAAANARNTGAAEDDAKRRLRLANGVPGTPMAIPGPNGTTYSKDDDISRLTAELGILSSLCKSTGAKSYGMLLDRSKCPEYDQIDSSIKSLKNNTSLSPPTPAYAAELERIQTTMNGAIAKYGAKTGSSTILTENDASTTDLIKTAEKDFTEADQLYRTAENDYGEMNRNCIIAGGKTSTACTEALKKESERLERARQWHSDAKSYLDAMRVLKPPSADTLDSTNRRLLVRDYGSKLHSELVMFRTAYPPFRPGESIGMSDHYIELLTTRIEAGKTLTKLDEAYNNLGTAANEVISGDLAKMQKKKAKWDSLPNEQKVWEGALGPEQQAFAAWKKSIRCTYDKLK